MLRAAVRDKTPVGLMAQDIMARGDLVPDEIVAQIVADRIAEPDCARGFILDGFPRTVAQAEILKSLLARSGIGLDVVVELVVDESALVGRIEKRARESGAAARSDDTAEALKKRLEVYRSQTAPLSDYYRSVGLLKTVDGMQDMDTVGTQLEAIIAEAVA